MASGGGALPNGVPAIHRHGAHDSALDVEPKDGVTGMRLRELEEENSLLAEKATAAGRCILLLGDTPAAAQRVSENYAVIPLLRQ